jgi:hypothetical protein
MAGIATITRSSAPAGAICSVSATVTLSAIAASALNVTVSTTSRTSVWFFPSGPTPWLWVLAIFGMPRSVQRSIHAAIPKIPMAPRTVASPSILRPRRRQLPNAKSHPGSQRHPSWRLHHRRYRQIRHHHPKPKI